jgi:hypothetical protein
MARSDDAGGTSGAGWRARAPRRLWSSRQLRAVSLALLLLGGACAGPPIAATPQPATGVFAELVLLGGSTVDLTSGDTGCGQRAMVPYAIHAQVRLPANAPHTTDVYLFTWADHAAWQRGEAGFQECLTEYAAGQTIMGRTVGRLEVSPYRAFGVGWSPQFQSALQLAMTRAAGNGG